MNKGSSRSHCALILTLHQAGDDISQTPVVENAYTSTTFTLIDLAGSECVSKTGAERMSAMEAITAASKGKEVPTGATGSLINFELSCLSTEVMRATEAHTTKKKYSAPRTLTTDACKFFGGVLDGRALCGMVICLSQAVENGWETWFSCEMASQLAKLKAPSVTEKVRQIDKELKDAVKAAGKAAEQLAKTPEKGAPASKFYPVRKGLANGTKRYVEILERLGAK